VSLPGFRESAVLVPILVEPGQAERLILIVREPGLRAHAGQIAFPGGKREEADADLATTAIRETSEELGIAPAAIRVLGLLDDVPTPTGFVITPVVARVDGPVALRPAASEVAEAFLVELAELRRPATYRSGGVREFLGVRYEMHEYHVPGPPESPAGSTEARRVWGATARIVWQLLGLLG
jgi:8-oxo-dGTP pyrophosphatase MutT (NUDIX family)